MLSKIHRGYLMPQTFKDNEIKYIFFNKIFFVFVLSL
jgi:hypothetical protein